MAVSAMAESMTTSVPQQQRFSLRTETARERDVYRHLHPWVAEYRGTSLDRHAFPADDGQPMPEPAPCPDTALVAFAQLCALRLRARRCFVTLISSHVEYVLAESAKSMSLQYDTVEDAKDKPWLGTCSFSRDDGLSTGHMNAWRRARQAREDPVDSGHFYTNGSSPHWHIISDVRNNEEYARRNFVRRSSGLRFYAAIPLRGAFGSVLGSLTIVDDIPRYGISAAELSFMEDVADTITQHLDATVVRSQRKRSERMIQSLGLFNNGKSSLRHWWLKQEDERNANIGRHRNGKLTARERTEAANQEFGLKVGSSSDKETTYSPEDLRVYKSRRGESARPSTITATTASLENVRASTARAGEHISGRDFNSTRSADSSPGPPGLAQHNPMNDPPNTPKRLRKKPLTGHPTTRRKQELNEDFDLATATQHTYSRASNLMREALGADGVVFVNSTVAALDTRTSGSEHSNASDRLAQQTTSDGDTSDPLSPGPRPVAIHAFSTTDRSTERGSESLTHRFEIPEAFLASLIQRYPNGHIFNFTQDGAACSSSNEDSMTSGSASNSDHNKSKQRRLPRDGKRLGEIMVGARTIAFYPVWDETRDRFCSCAFVWSTSPLRYFDQIEDITYLASWGHSVLAELRRLEAIAADKAKASFISSVSHELRSPLHGVLAGIEFLEETELTSFQQEMAHTISMAGRTLLDTVNHILDFAKMSSFTRAQRQQRVDADAIRHMTDTSKMHDKSSEIGVTNNVNLAVLTEEIVETVVSAHRFQNTRELDGDDLSIVVNIPWQKNWTVEISRGGWTRIVQNLVGNALKYTPKGLVSVSMDVGDPTLEDSDGTESAQQHWPIRFTVQDTGIGISEHFLANNLYRPFKQENSHSSGTGLGLSIVQQICRDMGARLKITSDPGTGTRASVDFKVRFFPDEKRLGSGSSEPVTAGDSEERELNVKNYHWVVPGIDAGADNENDTSAHGATSSSRVGSSVLETAKGWLDCETSQGPASAVKAMTGPWVFAITEGHLSQWIHEGSNILQERLANLTKARTHVLILGRSLRSVSLGVSSDRLPFIPIFIHQPIGPQKLLRAIASDQSSTHLGTIINGAAEDKNSGGNSRRMSLIDSPTGTHIALDNLHRNHSNGDALEPVSAQISLEREDKVERSLPIRTQKSGVTGSSSSALTRNGTISGNTTNTQPSVSRSLNSSVSASTLDDISNEQQQVEEEEAAQKRGKVLLVEDNEVNMKLLKALMRKQNIPHDCAVNGREAVDIYRAIPLSFFLILMDMSMPIMNGFTATAEIREIERKNRLPRSFIVALTGVTSAEAKASAFASGVNEFFSKPVHMKEVKVVVARAREEMEARESGRKE